MELERYIKRVDETWYYLYERRPQEGDPQLSFPYYELQCMRMDQSRRLRLNSELLALSPERTLNRADDEMDKLGESVWDKLRKQEYERICNLTDRTSGIVEKMRQRTMRANEYEALTEGRHPVFKKPRWYKDLAAIALLFLIPNYESTAY